MRDTEPPKSEKQSWVPSVPRVPAVPLGGSNRFDVLALVEKDADLAFFCRRLDGASPLRINRSGGSRLVIADHRSRRDNQSGSNRSEQRFHIRVTCRPGFLNTEFQLSARHAGAFRRLEPFKRFERLELFFSWPQRHAFGLEFEINPVARLEMLRLRRSQHSGFRRPR